MKNRIFILIALSFIFISTQVSAKGGFSLGLYGSYATDGGTFEDRINNIKDSVGGNSVEADTVMMPGSGLFARYVFNNNLFIRCGVEYYQLVSGGNIFVKNGTDSAEFEFEYMAIATPVFLGIGASPDKGKTYIYTAFGFIFARSETSMVNRYTSTMIPNLKEREAKGFVYGFGGIFGMEKKVTQNTFLMIEYAFYKCEMSKPVNELYYISSVLNSTTKVIEILNLPVQQVRLGLGYNF